MIENIKRFVNEHHTLIGVIVGVLVICFIYWWFCCKDRPVVNKIKGGGPFAVLVPFRVNGKIYYFWVLGKSISDECPTFYVLNEAGEKKAGEINAKIFSKYQMFSNLLAGQTDEEGATILEKIALNPLHFYRRSTYSIRDFLGLKDVNSLYGQKEEHVLEMEDEEPFDFRLCLERITKKSEEEGDDDESEGEDGKDTKQKMIGKILEDYINLNNFIEENLGEFVEAVEFIGQPGYYEETNEEEIGKINGEEEENKYYWSNESEGTLTNKTKLNDLLGKNRKWIDAAKPFISRFFYILKNDPSIHIVNMNDIDIKNLKPTITISNNEVKRSPKEKNEGDPTSLTDLNFGKNVINVNDRQTRFEVADIYPAQKSLMMIYLLLGYLPLYIEKNSNRGLSDEILMNEYLRMLASRQLFTYFFNTVSATNMHSPWNNLIGNACVYKYKNLNGKIKMKSPELNFTKLENITAQLLKKETDKPVYTPMFKLTLMHELAEGTSIIERFVRNKETKKMFVIHEERQLIAIDFISALLLRLGFAAGNNIQNIISKSFRFVEAEENIDGMILLLSLLMIHQNEFDSDTPSFSDLFVNLTNLEKDINSYIMDCKLTMMDVRSVVFKILDEFIKIFEVDNSCYFRNEILNLLKEINKLFSDKFDEQVEDEEKIYKIGKIIKSINEKRDASLWLSDDTKNLINYFDVFENSIWKGHEESLKEYFDRLCSLYKFLNYKSKSFYKRENTISTIIAEFFESVWKNEQLFEACNELMENFKEHLDEINGEFWKETSKDFFVLEMGDFDFSLKNLRKMSLYNSKSFEDILRSLECCYLRYKENLDKGCVIEYDSYKKTFKILSVNKICPFLDYTFRVKVIGGNEIENLTVHLDLLKFKVKENNELELREPHDINEFKTFNLDGGIYIILSKSSDEGRDLVLFSSKVLMEENAGVAIGEDINYKLVLSRLIEDDLNSFGENFSIFDSKNQMSGLEFSFYTNSAPLTPENLKIWFYTLVQVNLEIREFVKKYNQRKLNVFNNPNNLETCLIFCFLYLYKLGFKFPDDVFFRIKQIEEMIWGVSGRWRVLYLSCTR